MIKLFTSIKTTGTIPWKHGITEIAILVEKNGKVIDQMYTKMNPGDVEFDPKALTINNEKIEDIQKYIPQEFAFKHIEEILNKHYSQNEKFMIVAYNAPFVYDFILNMFKRYGVTVNESGEQHNRFFDYFYSPALDVMQLANIAMLDIRQTIPDFKFNTICTAFDLPTPSDNSCFKTVRLLFMLYNKLSFST